MGSKHEILSVFFRLVQLSVPTLMLFFLIKQRIIAVHMAQADSFSFVALVGLLAVVQHIQHWFP